MADKNLINRTNLCRLFVPISPLNMVANALVYAVLIVAILSIVATEFPSVGFVAIAVEIGFCASFSTWMFKGFPNIKKTRRSKT